MHPVAPAYDRAGTHNEKEAVMELVIGGLGYHHEWDHVGEWGQCLQTPCLRYRLSHDAQRAAENTRRFDVQVAQVATVQQEIDDLKILLGATQARLVILETIVEGWR